jgi:hypothetical protein
MTADRQPKHGRGANLPTASPASDEGMNLPGAAPELDFAVVLSRVIGSMQNDPAQLRHAVYELARIKLQREAWQKHPSMSVLEIGRLTRALETAIRRVEAVSSRYDELQGVKSLDRLIQGRAFDAHHSMTAEADPILLIEEMPSARKPGYRAAPAQRSHKSARPSRTRHRFWLQGVPLLATCALAVLAFGVYVILDRKPALFGSRFAPAVEVAAPANQNSEPADRRREAQAPAAPSRSQGLPLPSVYGVYAVNGGQLTELEALAGRVPDERVFMSTAVKRPSRTIVPDGRLAFVAFRRDIASNAPDRVSVRVIAKIAQAMTFTPGGSASTATVEDQWTIRGTSYPLRVAPVSENPEMLIFRPEAPDFVFPSGRYGLVLKGQAYDFTVAGPITDPAQCLERVEAANGAFYTECRNQ